MTDETAPVSDTNENPLGSKPPTPLQLRVTALTDEVFPELMGVPTTRAAMIESFVSNVRDDSYYKADRIMEQLLRMRADHMAAEHMKYEGMLSKQKFANLTERVESVVRAKDATDIKNGLLLRERLLHKSLLALALCALEGATAKDDTGEVSPQDLVKRIKAALTRESEV